ncbi:MAG: aromatic-ring-hydroxylating dioxygenase subunit beta [Rhodospirillales bacterium]|jgi:3-phenylpropionate/cinnamic acid dioxygenase small subunit|nr:aromatic-ring-hydroxylating dioxygenase subunit beta [Rhodospirillales bacterium]
MEPTKLPPVAPALRARIEDFLAEIARLIDDDAVECWPEAFAEDATYRIIPRDAFEAGQPVGILSCEGRGMMRDRVLALRTANIFEPHRTCHVLGRPRLTPATDGTIEARSTFALYRTQQGGRTELFAAGKYLDRIIERDGALRLASREVVLESGQVDILIVLPI